MRRLVFGLSLGLGASLLAATVTLGQESRPETQEPRERPTSPETSPAPSPPPAPLPPPPPTPASNPSVVEPRARGDYPGNSRAHGSGADRARSYDVDPGTHRASPRAPGLPSRLVAVPDAPAASPPTYTRPRDGRPIVGSAVPRPSDGYWPSDGSPSWDWDHNSWYYPWGFGVWSFYDPLWSWFDSGWYYGGGTTYVATDVGHVKVKVRPNEAQVYVDGYFVGVVDEFDGPFQRLSLPEGPHRLEVKAGGFATLILDVRVLVHRTLTVRGELQRQP